MYINTLSPSLRGEGGKEREIQAEIKLCLPKCEHFKHKNPLFGLNDWNIYCNWEVDDCEKGSRLFDRIYLA